MEYVILKNEEYDKWKVEVNKIIEQSHPENRDFLMSIPEEMWHQDFLGEIDPIDSVCAYFEM